MDQRARDLLERVVEVCPLPAAAQRVISLTSQPDVPVREIAEAVAIDPAMAAEATRIANSAYFGRSRQVNTLEEAVVLLGIRELHAMASGMALLAAFSSKEERSLDLHRIGLVAGSIARSLASEIKTIPPSSAFLAGLLCEIGAMACAAVDGPGMEAIWCEWRAIGPVWSHLGIETRHLLEQERYGATTRQIGAELLRRNQLPNEIASAVESDVRPNGPPPTSPLDVLTAFSRLASPLMLTPRNPTKDAIDRPATLHQLSIDTHLGRMDAERLETICIDSVAIAEAALGRHVSGRRPRDT